jgi:hypothetical protein
MCCHESSHHFFFLLSISILFLVQIGIMFYKNIYINNNLIFFPSRCIPFSPPTYFLYHFFCAKHVVCKKNYFSPMQLSKHNDIPLMSLRNYMFGFQHILMDNVSHIKAFNKPMWIFGSISNLQSNYYVFLYIQLHFQKINLLMFITIKWLALSVTWL